jgi:hypothetical protein
MNNHNVDVENWPDYDDRKKRGGSDHRDFACTESWEVDYLIGKIIASYSYLTREEIRKAIEACCQLVRAPHPRKKFVDCVMQRLPPL